MSFLTFFCVKWYLQLETLHTKGILSISDSYDRYQPSYSICVNVNICRNVRGKSERQYKRQQCIAERHAIWSHTPHNHFTCTRKMVYMCNLFAVFTRLQRKNTERKTDPIAYDRVYMLTDWESSPVFLWVCIFVHAQKHKTKHTKIDTPK